MSLLESSIARLMLAALTAAVGLMAMKTQSDFWFGTLVSAVVAWCLLAVGTLVSAHESRRRPFWAAFIMAGAASLLFGFGPWSDASVRGHFPEDARATPTYLRQILSTTKALLLLRPYVEPHCRGAIKTLAGDGRAAALVEVTIPADHPGDLEQYMLDLKRSVDDDIKFFSSFRPGYATRQVAVSNSLSV
jgi:hypothetical protein